MMTWFGYNTVGNSDAVKAVRAADAMRKDDEEFNLKCLKLNCYFHFIRDLKSIFRHSTWWLSKIFSCQDYMIFGGELVAEHNILRLGRKTQK